ncbi:MAG: FGGY-family carbohydrate kinase [Acidimicrobiia bacterium]
MNEVTVGLDIGTSSVKAVAADGDGNVVASSRVPHSVRVPAPGRFEHDAAVAWRAGPLAALAALGDLDVRGVSVSAMVPSLAAVDDDGTPRPWGLLYGDERGSTGQDAMGDDIASGGFVGFLRWLAAHAHEPRGFWPAQTVANYALSGRAVLDTTTAALAYPLFDWTGWDEELAREIGVQVAQLPSLVPTGWQAGRVGDGGPALASGCVDAFAEQLVAGADRVGDVLVLLGTTLLVWVVNDADAAVPGYLTVPHTVPGQYLIGGPSNAGGLFRDWVTRMLGDAGAPLQDARRVPVWAPYPRGERVPLNDPTRRATLDALDLTHGPASVRRAADEASAFVVRRVIEAAVAHAGVTPRRVVASGGGTRVDDWVQALADGTDLPVECVAVPEGAALGSAWLARLAAGLEDTMAMTDARRWARSGRRFEPRRAWVTATAQRYRRFLALSERAEV